MTGGIFFSGIGSGLDTASLVSQLVALERIPINQLEDRKETEEDRIKEINKLKGLVTTLQDAAETLSETDKFFAYDVSISSEVAEVSASGSVEGGSHSIEVTQVATTDRIAFAGVADPDVDLGLADGQTLSFDINGTTHTLTVDAADSSLNEIAAAMNSQLGEHVTASVVNVGTEATPDYQLVVSSENSGADHRLLNVTSTIDGLTTPTTITTGENAIAVIDGLTIERADNDFSDVVDGLSITLLSADPGSPATISIEPNKEGIKENLKAFTDAYNAVISFVNTQRTFTEGVGSGLLSGDSILGNVTSEIRSAVLDIDPAIVAADTGGFTTLGLIGIETQSDGTLVMDDVVIDEKLAEDLDAFADLFLDTDGFDNNGAELGTSGYHVDTTTDSGIATSLMRAIDRLTDKVYGAPPENQSFPGPFDGRIEAIQSRIDSYETQIERKERRLVDYETFLRKKFTALERVMAQLQAQGAALLGLFN